MGAFTCNCGYVIRDSVYPCPLAGNLMWEPELEAQSEETTRVVNDFLKAVRSERRSEWVRDYFGDDYPSEISDAEVIDDIYSKVSRDKGRFVYQCPTCERIYVQKQVSTNVWDCFEKAR